MNTVLACDRGQQSVDSPVQAAALALRSARADRRPIAPISSSYGIAGLEAAYAVAELNTQARIAEGRQVVGKKIGLTSRSVQQQLGVDQPDFGVLFDDMEFLNGANIPMQRLMQPKVEAEVAFVVGQDLLRCATELVPVPARDRLRAAGHRDRRQRHRRLEDQPGRHGGRQRLVRPVRARRSARGAGYAVARRAGHAHDRATARSYRWAAARPAWGILCVRRTGWQEPWLRAARA